VGRTAAASCAAALAAIFLAALPALAQVRPDTIALDSIVVTATRLAAPRSAVPAAVSVIEGAVLRASGVRFVADALRSVPGLAVVQTGSRGGLVSVFVRGAESDHVLVLVDGVAVNDPGGAVDLASLTTADVERIEVVRGPASVLYGTDAAAGVIHVFTRRGAGPARIEATLAGSGAGRLEPDPGRAYGFDAAASVMGGGPRSRWSLSGARSHDGGARARNNRYENAALAASLALQPSPETAVSAALRFTDGRYHFPTDGGGAAVDGNQYRDAATLSASLEAGRTFGPRLELRSSLTASAADYRLDDAPDGPADTLGFFALATRDRLRRHRLDLHANVRARAATLTLGATAERQQARSRVASQSSFGPFEDRSENQRSTGAGYVQLLATPGSGVSVTAGARVEQSSRFGTLATWRSGLKLRGGRGALRLAAGTGFKEPTFFENFATGFVRGNPALEPERTRSIELGAERALAGDLVRLEATAFVQRLANLIQYTATPPAAGASNYYNVGEATASGLELAARVNAAESLAFDVAYTLLRTRVSDAGFGMDRSFLQGRPLLRRPRHEGSIAAGWRTAAGRLHGQLAVTGARDDLDFSDPADFAGSRVRLPAHARLDLAFERILIAAARGPRLELLLSAHNLLDARYEEVRNFPAARRTVRVGIRGTAG
jgi:vitamin B12 transporter